MCQVNTSIMINDSLEAYRNKPNVNHSAQISRIVLPRHFHELFIRNTFYYDGQQTPELEVILYTLLCSILISYAAANTINLGKLISRLL